jgi:hypothetical protein
VPTFQVWSDLKICCNSTPTQTLANYQDKYLQAWQQSDGTMAAYKLEETLQNSSKS